MAATYVDFDATTVHGATIAKGVDLIQQGIELVRRGHGAANVATDAGTTKDALIGGDFGAANTAQAVLYWTQLNTIVTLLNTADSGGFTLALGSLDKGVSE